uniref:Uncharacterized protein n=1 Tax=Glossina brevipalpis TaxID=37001 RepID=A0A1A9X1Q3_9MUSC
MCRNAKHRCGMLNFRSFLLGLQTFHKFNHFYHYSLDSVIRQSKDYYASDAKIEILRASLSFGYAKKFAFLQVNCKAHSGHLKSGKFCITKYSSLQRWQSPIRVGEVLGVRGLANQISIFFLHNVLALGLMFCYFCSRF